MRWREFMSAKTAENVTPIRQGGLVAALIEAKKVFKPARKTSENPHFKSHFADLAECIDATEEALSANGLTVMQGTKVLTAVHELGESLSRALPAPITILVTTLEHVGGEKREGEYPIIPTKDRDPQALAAALTYGRRNAYMAILGIAPEDDDGNQASGKGGPAPKAAAKSAAPSAPPAAPSTAPTPAQVAALFAAIGEMGPAYKDRDARLKWVSEQVERPVASSKELSAIEVAMLIDAAKAGVVK